MRIVLTASSSYWDGRKFTHGEPVEVDDEQGASLLSTGLFDVAPALPVDEVSNPGAAGDHEGNAEASVDLTKLKKDALIELATQLGVSTEGTKAELIAAIQAYE